MGETLRTIVAFGTSSTERQIYDLCLNPVLDSSGQPIGAAQIIRNITEEIRQRGPARK
ncbi:PAS domain-containing protein [Desulfofustis glycolicus]|uniref:PAS domain-containing protein n=1 Tax=Desulfofustis glycolicus TaxID=51195 RepID=UPI000A02E741|nr:PAS domain-containing protein [Desulfobulbaceae bacterium]